MKRTRSTKGGKPGDEMMLSRVSDNGELPDGWGGEGLPESRRRTGSVRPTEMPEPRIAGMPRQQPAAPPEAAAAPPGRVRVRESRTDSSYSYEYSSDSGESSYESNGAPAALQEGYGPRQLAQHNVPAPVPVPPSDPPPPMPQQPMMPMLPPTIAQTRPSEEPAVAWRPASIRPEPFAEPVPAARTDSTSAPMMAPNLQRYIIPASVGVVLAGVAIMFALGTKSSAARPSADATQANAPGTAAAVAAGATAPAGSAAVAAAATAPHGAEPAKSEAPVVAQVAPPASPSAHPGHAPKWHAGAKKNKAGAAGAAAAAAAADNAQAAPSPVGAYSVAPAAPPAPADKKPLEDEAAAELGSSLK
jgi:hypothetical protein